MNDETGTDGQEQWTACGCETWALETKQAATANVVFTDISAYLKNSVICPSGGTTFANSYATTTVSAKPTCTSTGGKSANGHELPPDTAG